MQSHAVHTYLHESQRDRRQMGATWREGGEERSTREVVAALLRNDGTRSHRLLTRACAVKSTAQGTGGKDGAEAVTHVDRLGYLSTRSGWPCNGDKARRPQTGNVWHNEAGHLRLSRPY